MKINKHIEIVSSADTFLSSMGKESRDAIHSVLSKHYTRVGITLVNNISDLEALVASKPDLVFLGMKFLPVNPALSLHDINKIWLSDYLDAAGITYTGSGQRAHELELNKPLAKQRVLDAGLSTSPFHVIKLGFLPVISEMSFDLPMFVKPANRGGGVGIDKNSVIRNHDELMWKVQSITDNFQADSLIEAYLPGREFSVAILKDYYSEAFSVMPIELVAEMDARGSRLLSQDVKSSNAEGVFEVSDEVIRAKVCTLALDVFDALGANDYGRIDIRLDEHGEPQFLEANLIPSLIDNYGSFPKSCLLNAGLDHETVILNIVQLGLSRSEAVVDDVFEDDTIIDAEIPFGIPVPAV